MKAKELRALSADELSQKAGDLESGTVQSRFRQATKQLDNTSRIRVVRKDIALIKTVMRERQLGPSDGAA